ncbi:MAG: 1,4-dihydroxy-2-naphthoate octaprenyltransferase [Bacteroidetes bacterium]|nr:1,4-dihydroxy-2-naphthoate octaprenyltransferase [Bacteroidota bacterium]
MITALLLQILSNYANDYGDFKKGTDLHAARKDRVLSSGALNENKIKLAIILISILSLISGIRLLLLAFNENFTKGFLTMLVLGLLAILASITYTVGKNAYGYKALGDLFVFIFFGPVAVLGCIYLQSPNSFISLENNSIIACIAASLSMGFASSAVLTINNIRDIEKDRKSGKITIPVLLGFNKAKLYFYSLVIAMLSSFIVFIVLTNKPNEVKIFLIIIAVMIFGFRMTKIFLSNQKTTFPYFMRELKYFSLSTITLPLLAWF